MAEGTAHEGKIRRVKRILQTDIDLSSLGVERRTDNEPYFYTPKSASVFGWTGVDGIHFCFVRGFGGIGLITKCVDAQMNDSKKSIRMVCQMLIGLTKTDGINDKRLKIKHNRMESI